MIRDLKINYGILDDIVEQLTVYHQALQTMETSLHQLKVYMKTNEGEAIDAWEEKIAESEDTISEYAEQVTDLLTLFDGYVTDTTAYITPVARQAMMRVDRNDIWFNLCQISAGISQHTMNAVCATQRAPSILNLGDLSQEAREASSQNKAKLDLIRDKIKETNQTMSSKMDSLWDLYNSKVKPFENTDDDYSQKANDIKKKYTSMWEWLVEGVKNAVVTYIDFIRGVVAGLVDLVEGVLVLVGNGLILVISDIIPDEIEPAFLKNKSDSIIDDFQAVTKQLLEDPFIIVESIGQSISDAWEEEGAMYMGGYVAADVLVTIAGGKALQSGSILGDVSSTGRTVDKIGDTTQALDKAGDVAKQVDRVEDVGRGVVSRIDYLRNKYGYFTSKELNYRINLRGETLKELQKVQNMGMSKKKIGPAFAGVYDKSTGKTYYAINDYDGILPEFHPIIKSRYDSMTQEVIDSYTFTKGAGSHAEVIALNKALNANPNVSLDNFVLNVIRTGQSRTKPAGMMFPRCPHCAYLTGEFEIITEVSKNVK